MIITKDFVFIHMPKTGGTFVHALFKKIIANYKKSFPIRWYWNRIAYKLNLNSPIYQKLNDVSYYEYPSMQVKGQHAGISFIPKKFQKLPVISVKRNPVKKFISVYYFRWWERFPLLPLEEINKIFPHFPDISMEEYFELAYKHEMKHFFGNDYRDDIGVLSWQFISMYSTEATLVYKNITQANFDIYRKKYFKEVHFLEMENLSSEFEVFLETTTFSKYSDYFATKERIYPPGSKPNQEKKELTVELENRIKTKEWLLYQFFPEYNL